MSKLKRAGGREVKFRRGAALQILITNSEEIEIKTKVTSRDCVDSHY